MFQIAIDINKLLYNDLPVGSLSARLKKAKLLLNLTQKELATLTGLSRATINEIEAGCRENISRATLIKLISVLDKDIICDDYLNFILKQEDNINNAISKFGVKKLSYLLNCDPTTIYRWRNFKFQVPKKSTYY